MVQENGTGALPSDRATAAEPVVSALRDGIPSAVDIAKIGQCLAFFASVIKSGEPWTETCRRDYEAAQAALTALRHERAIAAGIDREVSGTAPGIARELRRAYVVSNGNWHAVAEEARLHFKEPTL